MEIISLPLTDDDAFNSHPQLGTIAYRLPSIDKLFGQPMSFFDKYWDLEFTLSILAQNNGAESRLSCSTKSKCYVKYRRHYTPVVYYLSPPVVYYGSEVEIWFDPKSV